MSVGTPAPARITVFPFLGEYAKPPRGAKARLRPMVWLVKRPPKFTDRLLVNVQRSSANSEISSLVASIIPRLES